MTDLFEAPRSDRYYDQVLRKLRVKRGLRIEARGARQAQEAGRDYIPSPKTLKLLHGARTAFIGCDGEGGGTNDKGQQHYRAFRMGNALLFDDNRPLSTLDCLDFICDQPGERIYVGFAFGYDTTQILRDLPAPVITKIFERQEFDPDETDPAQRQSEYVYWRNYAIAYRSGQYLRVGRVHPVTNRLIKGSSRTIYETFGFFQKSFVATLRDYRIGKPAQLDAMEATKAERGSFELMTPEILKYNEQECRWLAQLMEELRRRCKACGIVPHTWSGAGKLAAALMRKHQVIRRERVEQLVPPAAYRMADHAYYGGRSETSRTGIIDPLVGHDLRSAYMAAMVELPCLEHAVWEPISARPAAGSLWLGDVEFFHPKGTIWCGLPWRAAHGGLKYPRIGRGSYWGCEIEAAERLGARIKFRSGWVLRPGCDDKPLAFLSEVYDERRRMEESLEGSGIPLKLAGNSVYGKLVQRIGAAPFHNPVWGGMITAQIRGWILDALASASDPAKVIYIATDGIFATEPLALPAANEGKGIGQWEITNHGPAIMVMPGMYWPLESGDPMIKTRGVSKDRIRENTQAIEAAWRDYERRTEVAIAAQLEEGKRWPLRAATPFPAVPVEVGGFIGLRLAAAQGDLNKAGRWAKKPEGHGPTCDCDACGEATRHVSFKWYMKRDVVKLADIERAGEVGLSVITLPHDGTRMESYHFNRESRANSADSRQRDLDTAWRDGQPDNIEPFEAAIMEGEG